MTFWHGCASRSKLVTCVYSQSLIQGNLNRNGTWFKSCFQFSHWLYGGQWYSCTKVHSRLNPCLVLKRNTVYFLHFASIRSKQYMYKNNFFNKPRNFFCWVMAWVMNFSINISLNGVITICNVSTDYHLQQINNTVQCLVFLQI